MATSKNGNKPGKSIKKQKTGKSSGEKKVRKLKTELEEYLKEIALDEERILANLTFDPVIIGGQLRENHFAVSDFQGIEANRILIGAMLELLDFFSS